MKILVSACLCGIACRYDGNDNYVNDIKSLYEKHSIIPFCPECFGGLATPRAPSEINGDKVLSKDGVDVTTQYKKGAQEALKLCKSFDIKYALLKERSPSCGSGKIYDGRFSKKLVSGYGVCAKLLMDNNVKVFGESEIDAMLNIIESEETS